MERRVDYGDCIEILLSAIYHRIVKAGDTVIDGGSNGGLHAIPLGQLVGPNGRVYAYEPLIHEFDLLRKWVDYLNLNSRMILRNVAIGKERGCATFYQHMQNSALSSIVRNDVEADKWKEIKVNIVKLDDEGINRCSFIKLDLEGGERDAIFGGVGIFNQCRPVVAFENGFDWSAKRFGYDIEEFFDFFERLDYVVYDFSGEQATIENFSQGLLVWELIALPREYESMEVVLETIDKFNQRLYKLSPAESWQIVMDRVQNPFSTEIWV
jgi:FkbM family methyltransferase